MSKRANLRRSRRAAKSKSDYNVGDLVEITRGSTTLKGRLAQLLTETASPNPRWLVKFDGQNHKDEEVYEHTFAKTIEVSGSPKDTAEAIIGELPLGKKSKASSNSSMGSSEELIDDTVGNGKKKSVTFSAQSSANNSADESSTTSKPDGASNVSDTPAILMNIKNEGSNRSSAREQRSRRRQAMIDVSVTSHRRHQHHTSTGKRSKTSNHSNGRNKRQRTSGNGSCKGSNNKSDEECVTVKLLTGTLYIYRGASRRAEFVRRI